ncbi:MAG TPA: hypothetical protein VMZ71_14810 [Gemmataceae bacterium]|nr:hypothetical protein [Gemmataceae bacterium]
MRTTAVVLLYAGLLVSGTYQMFRPMIDTGFAHTQVETGDGMLNHYILEHSWQVVSNRHYRGTLLSPPFFHPQPLVLGYSENLLGAAPVYWALRLGLPEGAAYQGWQVACALLNFAAMAVVGRWFRCSQPVAALGAFVWGFALVHVHQAQHQQMIPRFFMPFAAWYAWQLASAPSVRALNRMFAAVFLQAAACVYTGWFLTVGVATFVPIAIACGGTKPQFRQWLREHRGAVIRTAALWGVVYVAFFVPYLLANIGMAREYRECAQMIPRPEAWLTGPEGSAWGAAVPSPYGAVHFECLLFCGFGVLLVALAAAVHVYRSPRPLTPAFAFVAAGLLTAVLWVLLTLNVGSPTEGWSAWWVLRFFPGGQAIRVVSRVFVIVYLFGGLAGMVWLSTVLAGVSSEWGRFAVAAGLSVFIACEQTGFKHGSFSRDGYYGEVNRLAVELRGADVGYLVPRAKPHHDRDLELYGDVVARWVGLKANVPVVNGYSGRFPPNFDVTTADLDASLRAWLAGRFRGTVTIIDPHRPGEARRLVID